MTAIRCETCRWGSPIQNNPLSVYCRSHPQPLQKGFYQWCGEWAHDPRRFYLSKDCAWLTRLDDKSAIEPILWPWEVEGEA